MRACARLVNAQKRIPVDTTYSVEGIIEAWHTSHERDMVMQDIETAKTKPPAESNVRKWKPPPIYLQLFVLFCRRMQAILNNREQTLAPVIIFFILDFIIATYVDDAATNQPTNQPTNQQTNTRATDQLTD
jgi:hypothetical protein